MDFLISAFNLILYQPLFNGLSLLYHYIPGQDFGVAVIALTVIIRIILYPLMAKSVKSQKVLSELQPKIKELQAKFKDDKEKQVKETFALYKVAGVSPFGGILPILIQLPVLIALYRLFWNGLQASEMIHLYSFVPNPGSIDPTFFNMINLAESSLILAFIAGITQFVQAKMLSPKAGPKKGEKPGFSDMMQKQMLYFFPIFTVFILWKLPAAIGLYWITNNLFSIFQQYLIFRKK